MWQYYNDWSSGWGHPPFWMTLQTILIIGGIAIIFVLLRKGMAGKNGTRQGLPTARQILDQRYAKGEIDHETYEQMKKDIQ